MKFVKWDQLSKAEQQRIFDRPVQKNSNELRVKTAEIITAIKREGDSAVKKYTEKFDGVLLDDLAVNESEFIEAEKLLPDNIKRAIQDASQSIRLFHEAQQIDPLLVSTREGILCERQARPLQRVGLYIPGGSAPLPSTVLMLGIPAQIVNNPLRVLCTPPQKDGSINPAILYAAKLCGIQQVYKIGGAQAIAAMSFGTETVPKVDKIFGPGNSWVTQAKMLVAEDPSGAAYDLPAGPSEVLIIADESANPAFVAADLLSQAEHGSDSQVILLTDCESIAIEALAEIEKQIISLPRAKIARESLANSVAIVVRNIEEAIACSNEYAPEHLILQMDSARDWISQITCAGSVFIGHYTPEAIGDYASGTNHVLPTYGYAKQCSGLSLRDFVTEITFQEATQEGLNGIAETVCCLADVEGLAAHKAAVTVRCKR